MSMCTAFGVHVLNLSTNPTSNAVQICCISIVFSNLVGCDVLQVRIDPLPGKKVEHTGVKIELLGQIGTV